MTCPMACQDRDDDPIPSRLRATTMKLQMGGKDGTSVVMRSAGRHFNAPSPSDVFLHRHSIKMR